MKNGLIVIILVVLGVIAWYLFGLQQSAVDEAPPPPPLVEQAAPVAAPAQEPMEPEITAPEPTVEPVVEAPPLPELANSDPVVIASLAGLVGDEPVEQFVAHEDLVSRVVATVDALSSQQVPAAIKPIEGPGGEFQATADDDPQSVILNATGDPIPQFVVDPVNYARYTPYVEMLEAAEPAEFTAAYRDYRPLFEEAFRQLGYPEGDFDQRLRAVIDELLATPDVTEPPRLIKPEAYYLYADQALESLTAGQKVLIRMGPDNAARVKARLAAIRDAL
jgi:hypothetical protein